MHLDARRLAHRSHVFALLLMCFVLMVTRLICSPAIRERVRFAGGSVAAYTPALFRKIRQNLKSPRSVSITSHFFPRVHKSKASIASDAQNFSACEPFQDFRFAMQLKAIHIMRGLRFAVKHGLAHPWEP